MYFPKGMYLYQDMPGIKWGVWALLFESYAHAETLELKKATASAKRRARMRGQMLS